jgi:multidrug efflux pump subunit AcrA (membrane-fusion protein)
MMRFLPATLLVAACGAPAPLPTELSPTQATTTRVVKEPPPPAEFVGVITTRESRTITAKVQAPIKAFHVQPGEKVNVGAPIAELDTGELEIKLAQAQANEKAAEMEAGSFGAQLGALRQKVVAETRLHGLGVSSSMALRSAQAELGQVGAQAGAASAKAIAARAEVDQARKNLDNAKIVAPINGVVTNIRVHEGQAVQYGTPLARVFDPSDFIVKFAVPREQIEEVKRVGRVQLKVEGSPRPIWAQVTKILAAQEPPINFTVVEADIDDAKLAQGELRVAAVARVRIAEAERGAKR